MSTLPQVEQVDSVSETRCSAASSGSSDVSRFFIRCSTARRAERGPSPGSRASALRSASISWKPLRCVQVGDWPCAVRHRARRCGSSSWDRPTLRCRRSNALVEAGHEVVGGLLPAAAAGGARQGGAEDGGARAGRSSSGIEVRTPKSLRNEEEQASFAALDADLAVVAAYGLILPKPILDAPRMGCVNVHASLLPRWRGAAPIQRAILAGDEVTGVTIMQMDAGPRYRADAAQARRCRSTARMPGKLRKNWRNSAPRR